ncbi:AAA family ATPase [Halosegnis marinus]|uniref:AAA family ATPase n=1 Tax=Halosegnis marinus TaxID=3034023 RepID=A0ABD5ZRM3_9EURY|nr:AAA family ATPase [Halosegnis sp. DT85]
MNTPTLVVVCGLPGAGKTTVAEEVADRLDAAMLRTDVVRKELFSDPDYTDAEAEAVYDELFARAADALADGNVVLDATFRTRGFREGARATADRAGADFRLVSVECDDAVARERIRSRTDDESDADIRVYELFRDEYEPVERADLVVDNSGALPETFAQLDGL